MFFNIVKLLFNKYIRRQKTGVVIKKFCEKMGVVYIKLAQILATQNFGNLFTEEDRIILSSICDDVNPIDFEEIKEIIENEYNKKLNGLFSYIDPEPLGSASISQVHKAVLLNGEIVAVKVKRKDITNKIEKDINRIKRLIHRFGKIFGFKNLVGGDKALELYLSWIYEETDFNREKQNITTYNNFALSVNEKIENTKNIMVPKLYENMCTENILVMEYIKYKTINKLELNNENNELIRECLNSYLSLSFYALFHDQKIVFHGDPHGGNIYIDDYGNIGFLDMGLIFELSSEDSTLTREFFLSAYGKNYEKLTNMLTEYAIMTEEEKDKFKEQVKDYVYSINTKPVTRYFTDMINICLGYNIAPPNFLFCMAKAFVCLDGINVFSKNKMSAINLLQEQTMEYFINRSLNDCKNVVEDGLLLGPKLIKNTLKYGIIKGLTKETTEILKLRKSLKNALDNCDEIINVINN